MKITKIALGLIAIAISSQVCAKTYLTVWEDDLKSQGITEAIKDFEEQFDCEVKVKEVPFLSQVDKLRLDGPTGQGPDVLLIPADRVGAAVVQHLINPVKFMQEDQDKYIKSAVNAFTINSEIYAVPKVVESLVMFYNKDLLKQPYETLEDYYYFSKKIVDEKADQYGLLAKWDNFYYAYGAMQPFGSYVFGTDSDGNLDPQDVGLDNDGSIKGVETIKKFFENGCFPDAVLGESGVGNIDRLFINGKAAAVINGPWALEPYSNSNINFGVTTLPVVANGKPMSSFLGVKGYVISAWTEHHNLAEQFLKFINQPQYVKERYVKTKEIPPLKAVLADPMIINDDFANAIAIQASRAVPIPSIPEMYEVWGPINEAISKVVTDKATVKDALRAADEHVNYQIETLKSGL